MATTIDSEFGPIDVDAHEALGMTGGVAIFNPAIKGTGENGNPVILLAVRDEEPCLFVVNDEGQLLWTHTEYIKVDWRFDWKTNEWADVNGEPIETE